MNMMSDEFKVRMKEEYGTKATTIEKYATSMAEKYPFVVSDIERFQDAVIYVCSELESSCKIYTIEGLSKLEKRTIFARSIKNLEYNAVKEYFPVELEMLNIALPEEIEESFLSNYDYEVEEKSRK